MRRGFTLIELMIVVAIIAIIAAVAIPGLMRSRLSAHEASALAALKSFCVAQQCFRNSAAVDLNRDGAGEFGFLEEMAGTGPCRSDNSGGTGGPQYISSPYVPSVFGITGAADQSTHSGYEFICYLPASPNTGVKNYPTAVDVPLATVQFLAYAYPAQAGRSGVRVFATDVGGDLYQFPNTGSVFGGGISQPAWNALLGDNDGTGGVTWDDGPDLGGPGQTASPSNAWSTSN